jgi:diaminopimelate epimerase
MPTAEVEMCGNGIRCFAKYIWDRKLSSKEVLDIETPAGIIRPEKDGEMVKVDMGLPIVEGRQIPVRLDGVIREFPLKSWIKSLKLPCVSMGNPHAVIFVDDVAGFDVAKYVAGYRKHKLFLKSKRGIVRS